MVSVSQLDVNSRRKKVREVLDRKPVQERPENIIQSVVRDETEPGGVRVLMEVTVSQFVEHVSIAVNTEQFGSNCSR